MSKKKPDIEVIATQFVNLKNELAVKNFRDQYSAWLAVSDKPSESGPRILTSYKPLKTWSSQDRRRPPQLEKIIAEGNAIIEQQFLQRIREWSKQLRGAWGDDRDTAENALAQMLDSDRLKELRQVKLGGAQIEPRDLFDEIALAILKASGRGLLRMCQGHKQGWLCSTPYLVADEKRRVYCYSHCGDEAKSRAKHEWWKRNLSANARKRKRQ
jgi:hypothetical protein